MPERDKIEYSKLDPGYQFPAASLALDSPMISAYLRAVGDQNPIYHEAQLVPPMAIAARAMAALAEGMELPPGTIHISQELQFLSGARINDTVISQATVAKKQSRGQLHMMTIDLIVLNQDKNMVLTGKTAFLVPPKAEEE